MPSASPGRICPENLTCFHNEIEVADNICHLIQSLYDDAGPSRYKADLVTPGTWQGGHDSFKSLVRLDREKLGSIPGSQALEADALPLGHRCSPLWAETAMRTEPALKRCP